jgi:hypothetical protein
MYIIKESILDLSYIISVSAGLPQLLLTSSAHTLLTSPPTTTTSQMDSNTTTSEAPDWIYSRELIAIFGTHLSSESLVIKLKDCNSVFFIYVRFRFRATI